MATEPPVTEPAGQPSPAGWRLFVALELPDEVLALLEQLIGHWQTGWPGQIRWVPPANLHLTLKFLGNCPPEQAGPIADRLAGRVPQHLPIALSTERVGVFPGWTAPRVVWLGLTGDLTRLSHLQRAVEEGLIELGFPAERRPFRPHLTLGRVRDGTPDGVRRRIGDLARRAARPDPIAFTAGRVSLMRSHLGRSGATYDRLASWEAPST